MTDPSDKARIRDLEDQLATTQPESLRLQRDADDAHMATEVYRDCAAYRALTIRDMAEQLREAERHIADLQRELEDAKQHAATSVDLALGYAAERDAAEDTTAVAGDLAAEVEASHTALDRAGIERKAPDDFEGVTWSDLTLASRINNLVVDRDDLLADAEGWSDDNEDTAAKRDAVIEAAIVWSEQGSRSKWSTGPSLALYDAVQVLNTGHEPWWCGMRKGDKFVHRSLTWSVLVEWDQYGPGWFALVATREGRIEVFREGDMNEAVAAPTRKEAAE